MISQSPLSTWTISMRARCQSCLIHTYFASRKGLNQGPTSTITNGIDRQLNVISRSLRSAKLYRVPLILEYWNSKKIAST